MTKWKMSWILCCVNSLGYEKSVTPRSADKNAYVMSTFRAGASRPERLERYEHVLSPCTAAAQPCLAPSGNRFGRSIAVRV